MHDLNTKRKLFYFSRSANSLIASWYPRYDDMMMVNDMCCAATQTKKNRQTAGQNPNSKQAKRPPLKPCSTT
ncbi:hypothetical protein VTJ04DRAFT_1517 [Mycothermus thermophilus]|uniref:uncharacterized protein n=1 Tax=Humicola insolens TaxID=85995 RepID=UPI0037420F6A